MERMGPGTWDRIKTLVTERGKNVRQGGDEIDTDYVRSKIQKVVSLAVDSHVLVCRLMKKRQRIAEKPS